MSCDGFSANLPPASARTIARTLNEEGVPGPNGKLWRDTTIRGHVKRATGLVNNELYIGRLIWNRLPPTEVAAVGLVFCGCCGGSYSLLVQRSLLNRAGLIGGSNP